MTLQQEYFHLKTIVFKSVRVRQPKLNVIKNPVDRNFLYIFPVVKFGYSPCVTSFDSVQYMNPVY